MAISNRIGDFVKFMGYLVNKFIEVSLTLVDDVGFESAITKIPIKVSGHAYLIYWAT